MPGRVHHRLLFSCHAEARRVLQRKFHAIFTLSVVIVSSDCLIILAAFFFFLISAAASSFSFCRPAVEYRALPEDFKYQLSRRTGGNLTWHDGRGQKTAGGRTVKLLQQPGTESLQVLDTHMTSTCPTEHQVHKLMSCDYTSRFLFFLLAERRRICSLLSRHDCT